MNLISLKLHQNLYHKGLQTETFLSFFCVCPANFSTFGDHSTVSFNNFFILNHPHPHLPTHPPTLTLTPLLTMDSLALVSQLLEQKKVSQTLPPPFLFVLPLSRVSGSVSLHSSPTSLLPSHFPSSLRRVGDGHDDVLEAELVSIQFDHCSIC